MDEKIAVGNVNAPKLQKRRRKKKPKRVLSDWFVVRVKTSQERRALKYLRRSEYVAFAPWFCQEDSVIEKPLFPGYIFVQGERWVHIKWIPGCLEPVMMGESPAYMPIREMKLLLSTCDREGVVIVKRERFRKGQDVRPQKGPFKNLWGVYTGQSAAGRNQALFKLFGRDYELEFDKANLTAFPSDDEKQQAEIAQMRSARVRSQSKTSNNPNSYIDPDAS